MIIRQSIINEIARKLDAGMICYIHRKTKEIKTVEDLAKGAVATEEWQKEYDALEANTKHYMKVTRMPQQEILYAMEAFIKEEELTKSLKKELTNCLKRKQPIRNFTQTVKSEEELEQYWLNFKAGWYQRWVASYFISAYNY